MYVYMYVCMYVCMYVSRWTARGTNSQTPGRSRSSLAASSSSWSSLRLLKAQGKDDEHADMASLTRRINSQQQQRVAAKPGHVRAAMAERQVKQCRAALEASEAEGASLQALLEELQGRIGDNCGRTARAKEELAAPERERDGLYRSLQSAGSEQPGEACLAASLVGALAASAVLPQEVFVELGQSRSDVEALLQKLHGLLDSRQARQATALRQAEEAAAATAAAAGAAAAAAAAASAGARPAEPAAGATGRPEEGSGHRAGGCLDGAGGGDGGDASGSPTIDEALRALHRDIWSHL